MTNFQAWIPPAGAVVDPPVHPKTRVSVLLSDGSMDEDGDWTAESLNWSAFGDGPSVVAYAVIEEYTPAPRAMKALWNSHRNCFEIYVTNVDYRDGLCVTVFGELP